MELQSMHEGSRRVLTMKVTCVGDPATGKTSIAKRYVQGSFKSKGHQMTIGVDFQLKVINWSENTIVKLQIWDVAGQERTGSGTRIFYKGSYGAIVVFDVTNLTTLENAIKWKKDFDDKYELPNNIKLPSILLANKIDLVSGSDWPGKERMDVICKENGFDSWFETSAKENIGIESAFKFLIEKIYNIYDKVNYTPPQSFPEPIRSREEDSCTESCQL
eukprot:TRINITY_DN1825_c0_g1_i1.p2 TRINITY_DN1825_c0_g1~~TRINITY_DN1825_c0_g1_i1.p2  ORF type:complete len:218 (+),score=21.66 TRINITY_DN1825_c0_g1_i1:633-1286(+)